MTLKKEKKINENEMETLMSKQQMTKKNTLK